ncbi:hypothetical protein GCM10010277_01680 [Streptomyces longisporoflavus]|uniref:hypothetical protein n=1 Tax=Streptomyces longisporoflavus TaxID=28044 RepID=UPI00167D5183|nr:hypothetical protein [Streptomyces longisporoflavus]GGV22584.1 hypothetical protein GCM10010277_01680 [Streptomyces longisporoflavus]
MNRTRMTTAILATAGALTATQLGLAGSASAADAPKAPKASAASAQSSACPIDIVYTSRFRIGSGGWVTGDGLYFGLKNKSTKTFKKVTFTVSNVKNVRFGTAKAKGGKVTHKTSKTVSVYDKSLKGKASLGVRVESRLLNTRSYKVKFKVHGTGWNCAVNQGTWGA